MRTTATQNSSKLRKYFCHTTSLFGFLHILLAFSKIIGGILIFTKTVKVGRDVGFFISALVELITASVMLASGIIWVISCGYPTNRPLNGVNLGFSIASFMAVASCLPIERAMLNTNCDGFDYYCKPILAKRRKYYITMIVTSVFLVILSLANLVISSKKCCCSRPLLPVVIEEVNILETAAPVSSKGGSET